MVISNNPKAKGLNIAENHNIPILSIDTNKKFDDLLSEIIDKNSIDLLILAGFMKILPQSITNKYDGMIINIHPSLLPKYKGLNTHQKVIKLKDKFHGASVHYVTSKLDDGPVIIQGRYDVVCPMISAWDLYRKLPEADFHVVQNAGHSMTEDGIAEKLIEYSDKYSDL